MVFAPGVPDCPHVGGGTACAAAKLAAAGTTLISSGRRAGFVVEFEVALARSQVPSQVPPKMGAQSSAESGKRPIERIFHNATACKCDFGVWGSAPSCVCERG